jgi:hypothetical protein
MLLIESVPAAFQHDIVPFPVVDVFSGGVKRVLFVSLTDMAVISTHQRGGGFAVALLKGIVVEGVEVGAGIGTHTGVKIVVDA